MTETEKDNNIFNKNWEATFEPTYVSTLEDFSWLISVISMA